jgi:Na+-transporting methylmalonyl-CoA/oxaloacetate decarboxylase gamma subunit
MRPLHYSYLLLLIFGLAGMAGAAAQTTKKEKRAQQAAQTEQLVKDRHFTFNARTAQPMRGSMIQLTPLR